MRLGKWLAHHRKILAGSICYVMFAPPALFALPLAMLLLVGRARTLREVATAALAGGFSIAWLVHLGALPDQAVRAALVIASAVFVLGAYYTRSTVTHRALLAVGLSAVAVGNLLYAVGSSWDELLWWVEREVSLTARALAGIFWAMEDSGQLSGMLDQTVRFVSDYHPAILAVQLMLGMALATALYWRIAAEPRGTRLGRFRDFGFSDHLGWIAIVPLIVMLTPGLASARLAAGNALLVLGSLYALRGVAVADAGLRRAGTNRSLSIALSVFVAFLILPIALIGAILLGVVDSRLDLRKRWA